MGLCFAGEMKFFRSVIAIAPREYSCSKRDHSFPQSTLTISSRSAVTAAALRFARKDCRRLVRWPKAQARLYVDRGLLLIGLPGEYQPATDNHLSEWIAGGTMIEVLYFSVIAAKRPPPSETRNPVVGSTDMGLDSAGDRNE